MHKPIYQLLILGIVVHGCAQLALGGTLWQIEPISDARFARPSLDVSPDGMPTIGYGLVTFDGHYSRRHYVIRARTDSTWPVVREVPTNTAGPFRFNDAGIGHFLSVERTVDSDFVLLTDSPDVQSYPVPLEGSIHVGPGLLAFDPGGAPQVGYTNRETNSLRVAQWTGADWDYSTVAEYGRPWGHFAGDTDAGGGIHLVFGTGPDLRHTDATYAKPTATGWELIDLGTKAFAVFDAAVDSQGRLHAVMNRYLEGPLYAMVDGTDVFVEELTASPWRSVRDAQVVIDHQDQPHLFMIKNGLDALEHHSQQNGSWAYDVVDQWEHDETGNEHISALFRDQTFHLAYSIDGARSFYATRQLVPEPNSVLLVALLACLAVRPSRRCPGL